MLRCAALLALPAAGADAVDAADTADAATGVPPGLSQALPGASRRGVATLRWMGLEVYQAQLWTPEPVRDDALDQALALALRYRIALSGARLAERSLLEMRRQGEVADERAQRWLSQLRTLLPDVAAGDWLLGVLQPGRGLRLLHNGQPRGELADAQLARRFFGIWLAPQSSEPVLRLQLLGRGDGG